VILEIRDQGRGLAADGKAASAPTLPGVGIQGMRERTRQLGGNFEIQSRDGQTLVRAEIPLQAAGAASSEMARASSR